jgi:hypothetical protein
LLELDDPEYTIVEDDDLHGQLELCEADEIAHQHAPRRLRKPGGSQACYRPTITRYRPSAHAAWL